MDRFLKQRVQVLIVSLALMACNQHSDAGKRNKADDTAREKKQAVPSLQTEVPERISFKNISEIVADSPGSIWVEKQGSNFSLALHFQEKDTVSLSYSPECWLRFPYKLDAGRLVVDWANNIDSKYDFDIVKAMKKIDKKYNGKEFMLLELENDTTLKATYPLKELVGKINSTNKERTFFPARFNLVQQGKNYD